jgi:hypothetical protein
MKPWYWDNVKYWRFAYLFYLPFTLVGVLTATNKLIRWIDIQQEKKFYNL